MKDTNFDLEDRLLEYCVRVIRVTEKLPRNQTGRYVADQLLRSATSPYGHHGEAESAESPDDFIHKLRVCHKELRESRRWLRLVHRLPLITRPARLLPLLNEAEELVRIFTASIQTAKRRRASDH